MIEQVLHPTVSVVLPLFNTERYVAQAISSVLSQDFEDFELIVVDDGSTDGGPAVARAFQDPRLRLVSQENRGLAGARNSGIREAKGRYIAFIDADDGWERSKLRRHVAALEADAGIGISFSASLMIDEEGNSLRLVQRPRAGAIDAAHVFCRNPVGNGSAPVLRRAALDSIGFMDPSSGRRCWFDESFRQSEDIECWTRLAALTAWRFHPIDAPLTRYRIASGGLSANIDRQLETWRRFRAKVAWYAPELERALGGRAEAYQLRYLARRSVRAGRGRLALRLLVQALRCDYRILIEEPGRTITTLAAALMMGVVRPSVLGWIQASVAGLLARHRISAVEAS